MINSPHNPTGGVLTKSDLEFIAELAQRYDFLVLADEIYSRNFYLGSEYLSIASLPGMRDRTIVVDGFSKAYAMTGWRLGYAILPAELAKTVTLFNNNTFSCVAAFVQIAGITALTGPDEPVLRMNEIFRQRRDRLIEGLNRIKGISCLLPEGAFYAFPNVSVDHRRRPRAGEVPFGRRRRRVRRRLVVRRRPAKAICASRTRLRSTTSTGRSTRSPRLCRSLRAKPLAPRRRARRELGLTCESYRYVSFIARLTSARTPDAISRVRAVPSAMTRSTNAGSSR